MRTAARGPEQLTKRRRTRLVFCFKGQGWPRRQVKRKKIVAFDSMESSYMSLGVVILAAGQGTRMNSKLPKVLHPIAGKPMLNYAVDTARALQGSRPTVVVGYDAEKVRSAVGDLADFVEQKEQRGTGHAVMQARDKLYGRVETVMVTYADMPLLTTVTLQHLYAKHLQTRACLTILTVQSQDTMGFGRVLRRPNGAVWKIVEESEATLAELAIGELNCGLYCFNAKWLWDHLPDIQISRKKQEFYLTDLVAIASRNHDSIESETLQDVSQVIGINTRVHLARVEKIARDRIREQLMLKGVTLIDPETTFVDAEVEIGADTVILPGTHIQGKTKVGADCRIGPHAQIRDCWIGDGCEISSSLLEESTLDDNAQVGPYCHLRPGTYLASDVHLGDHAELKNARLGRGTKMGHFSYIGDADVGERVNIGAGTITCNYDGNKKHRTVIGDDAFVGSDSMLVAPVKIGARSKTGAGAVVTQDVPPDSLAVGVPARVIRKLD
jgi:bifunctional UDP-N-acetylglucosamine pyrophosphorylase / glucosamine-1-phosphate N-acetyltransferase